MIAAVADALAWVADLRAALPALRGDRRVLADALVKLADEIQAEPIGDCDARRSEGAPCR